MPASGNGGNNKRKASPVAKEGSAPADPAQTHKSARKRSQNRISQKCLREKQLAQSQDLAAFLDLIQASRSGTDDSHTALMKAHLKLLEENQQIKAALLRMRKKLLSISNSAAATADDDIFDQILGRAKERQIASETSAQEKQITPLPNSKASLQWPGEGEHEDDGDNVETSAELDLANSDDPAQWISLTGGDGSSIEAQARNDQDIPPFPNFEGHRADFRANLRDELQWTPMMQSADFGNMADMLNSVGEPAFNLDLGLDFTEPTVSHSARPPTMDEAVRLSGKELADLVERGCIIYVLQILDIHVNSDNEIPPLALATLHQQYTDSLTDQVVADLAAIATNLLGVFAGLDAYMYGIGASDVMEYVMRWRIKPSTANRLAIPEPFRPTPLQYADGATHPLVIDFIRWPQLRDQLILLSRRANIDHIIDDIVFHTVVEVRQMRVSLGVVDLFYARVFPNMDCSRFSPVQNMDLVHTTLIAGPYDEAIRSITSELSLRMAQITGDIGKETPRDSSSHSSFQDSPGSKKHPLSANYGIDKLLQWKISQEFANKYPTLDCSDHVASYPTKPVAIC